ncbi:MAG TPA: hypothetical protein ENJ09_15120 [Planctomycetes bacterium]|nr:hypothetical protein [Planctomycetota bacterium]
MPKTKEQARPEKMGSKTRIQAAMTAAQAVRKAARTICDPLWGIVNGIVLNVTNAGAEGLNAKIQRLKKTACGYRNRERFRNAIYFHFGGLELYPDELLTHTKS